ncbi:MAG: hypothetical protein M1817_002951 [Caeruleum heppii]|nr:MAG: hypothetical protein M1817_002951 [Caeruleum heppii]
MEVGRSPKTSLLNVLTTTIILYHTTPYLPVRSLLALAATSKPLRDLIYKTPGVWRYLDLSDLKQLNTWYHGLDTGGVYWRRDRQTSRDMPEDDFYAAPLRHIFGNFFRREVFRDVQTLILDGLSVPVNVISEIILDEKRFHVRVLSIRDSKDVNDRKLLQLLRYAVRRSRPDGSPRLKALYTFSRRDAAALPSTRTISRPRPPEQENQGITSLLGAQIGAEWNEKSREALSIALEDTGHVWYQSSGLVPLSLQGRSIGTDEELEQTLELCQGIIAFDAILCRGPRHSQQKTSTSPGGSHDGLPRPSNLE